MKNRTELLTLTVFNTVALCVSTLPAIFTDPIPQTPLTIFFYSMALIAQNFLWAVILSIFLWPIFWWVRSDRVKIILSFVPMTLVLFLTFMNAKVFSFWRFNINASLLRMYFSKGGGSQVFEVHDTLYVWIAIAVVLYMALSALLLFLAKKIPWGSTLKKGLYFLIGVYVVAQSAFIFFATQNNMRLLQYTLKIPYFYDLSWAHALQKMHVMELRWHPAVMELRSVLSAHGPLHYPLHPLRYHVPAHPLNVLLIVIDTLRYDMLNSVNMPNLTAFAKGADQFLNNSSGGDCTRPGIFSLFYSIPATYWRDARMYHQGAILIRAFQANHYQLGIYASAPLLSPPFNRTVFATVKHLQVITPGKTSLDRDENITQKMQYFLQKAQNNKRPFFGFMFYDAPHAYNALPLHYPFHPIGFLNYFDIHRSSHRTPIFNLYKNAVFADDQLVEKVLMTLKTDHLSKNTVVIITADHGQEFNDDHNNYWEHASGFSKYQIRTPMIIAWPGRKPAVFHDHTTHFDLAPTLLKRILGVSNPTTDYSVGDDFFSKKQPKWVIAGNYAYFALITHRHTMQFHASGLYRFTDRAMTPLPHEKITPTHFSAMLREMRLYG